MRWRGIGLAAVFFISLAFSEAVAESSNPASAEETPLRAAVFVQNRAGEQMQNKVDMLNDLVTTRLSEKGFFIIDRKDVAAKFREGGESHDDVAKEQARAIGPLGKSGHPDSSEESGLDGGSALRISQMLGADYLVFVTITSLGHDAVSLKGEGTLHGSNAEVTTYTMRLSIKVLEGKQGGTTYGDTVAVSERMKDTSSARAESSELLNRLIDSGALRIAENISGKVGRIRSVQSTSPSPVGFSVKSNIDGATVELDGAVIGTTPGEFNAVPGIHQLRITKQWLTTWDKTVNISPNQVINVTLELSEDGQRRYTTLEQFKTEMAVIKQQSEADAYSKKKIAEGEKKKREGSYERIEGGITIHEHNH